MVKNLTDNTFDIAINSGDTVVVDFWAEWCQPCKMMHSILDEVSAEMPNVKFYKLNIDEFPDLAQENKIMSIPTMLIYADGEPVGSVVGAMPKANLVREISKFTETE